MCTMYMFVFIGNVVTMGFGCFLFLTTTVKAMENKLNSMNKKSISHGDQSQTYKKLSEFIEIHGMMKELRFYVF